MTSKPKVLVMVDWFAPGFKAGGPIRSAVNFAENLDALMDIYVLTTDRDLGDTQPYAGIPVGTWISRGGHQVCYLSPGQLRWSVISGIIRKLAPDYIYLNSMFSRYFTIYPILLSKLRITSARLVLAPRGMLRASALSHKSGKKTLYFSLLRGLQFSRGVVFHATDQTEEEDIRKMFGPATKLFRAGNLPGRQKPFIPPPAKTRGTLKMVFVGRIHPIKNLDFLLGVMQGLTGNVELTVIATLEDQNYWQQCQSLMAKLPSSIRVLPAIDTPNDQIEHFLRASHLFALPTRGENFGHAIFESLAAGRPVLISDQTPWRGLADSHAGWDLPLDQPEAFRTALQACVDMDQATLETWCLGAWNRAKQYLANSDIQQTMIRVFSLDQHDRDES